MKKDLAGVKLSSHGANEIDAAYIFDAAKKKALEVVQATKDSDEHGDEFLV